jgi:F-box protein 9
VYAPLLYWTKLSSKSPSQLDSGVDQQYRKKYFPPASSSGPPATSRASGPASTAKPAVTQPVNDLLASFAGLHIAPVTPEIEGDPLPPCPISNLPREIITHILRDVAVMDVGDFARSSQVCKTFAYIVATEESIWRLICLGKEVGFAGMHYRWQKDVTWGSLPTEDESDTVWMSDEAEFERHQEILLTTRTLLPILYSSSWKNMFRHRPRIRFNGCYICTVNYIRSGQASTNQVTWNSPVHIVTYYRYLRFFRDGTVLSLVTVAEPADVVHYLTRESAALHRDGSSTHLPSAVVQLAHRGRWYISPFVPPEDSTGEPADLASAERDVYVETEGAVPKYIYRMDLALQSAGKTTRNNKLAWRGFYSYNRLTDDWAEFGLRHDKPFFFSRVKSYGAGE